MLLSHSNSKSKSSHFPRALNFNFEYLTSLATKLLRLYTRRRPLSSSSARPEPLQRGECVCGGGGGGGARACVWGVVCVGGGVLLARRPPRPLPGGGGGAGIGEGARRPSRPAHFNFGFFSSGVLHFQRAFSLQALFVFLPACCAGRCISIQLRSEMLAPVVRIVTEK